MPFSKPSHIAIPIALWGFFLAAPVQADDDSLTRGELIGQSCFACHGPQGQGADTMPPIAGWDEDLMVEHLKDFQEGKRNPTVMDRHATGYSEGELRELAAYLSELD
ncbi:c-type cytochrome [Halorhodospira halophila]|uniref:Cytochrome c553-like protein n=1 Tax=Halorhodospira halophila (strain DSM 244 / SL1) TaxID=349124 RepID=A1WWN5_HALHL|nr:c-type cytochrome [Halorhodospira halophila]ABM62097.1 Cytochrome c553-like protein [Halorhodospira halophila SL1]MBK1729425.1 cytochrome C [Halorhodospira halophila]